MISILQMRSQVTERDKLPDVTQLTGNRGRSFKLGLSDSSDQRIPEVAAWWAAPVDNVSAGISNTHHPRAVLRGSGVSQQQWARGRLPWLLGAVCICQVSLGGNPKLFTKKILEG